LLNTPAKKGFARLCSQLMSSKKVELTDHSGILSRVLIVAEAGQLVVDWTVCGLCRNIRCLIE
uniref:Transcriptional regulator n=1 Tax=Gongylonema pulchrum TaxID=637853 RepID=A0A183EW52_9BILA